jgi:outer membrane receptor protein involved in Fe transport
MPEADQTADYFNRLAQVTWQRPVGDRLLFEGGASYFYVTLDERPVSTSVPPAAVELATGQSFRSRSGNPGLNELFPLIQLKNEVVRGSMAYTTGAHAFKVGFSLDPSQRAIHRRARGDYLVMLLNGTPVAADFFTTPYTEEANAVKFAAFAQEQWSIKRLTVNAGLRFDSLRDSYPDVNLPATTYLPARNFPGADVGNWKDLSPRLGVSWDLFGDGRTALKASTGKFVPPGGLAAAVTPAVTSTARLRRSWIDANGDFIPQGNPANPLPNGELGPSTNARWGQPVITLRNDPAIVEGWGVREFNWETSVGVQHELLPRLSVNASYNRRVYGNFTVIDNLAVAPSAYSPYCITVPTDPRLLMSGEQICELFDIHPSKLGSVDRLRTHAKNYGEQYEYWHGVDASVDARLRNGVIFQGGLSTGRCITDNCDVVTKVDNPSTLYCHTDHPFWVPSVKFLASYPLPKQFQIAATFQSMPGVGEANNQVIAPQVQALYVATNAEIVPSLGRNLAAGPNGTVVVNVVEPGSGWHAG